MCEAEVGNDQPYARILFSVLGRGGIGAMHLKISDQSWHDEVTAAPLLPTLRVLGKVQIEILRAEIAPAH